MSAEDALRAGLVRLRAAGVPEEQVRDETAELVTLYEPVRRRLERDAQTFGEARVLLSELLQCEDDKSSKLRELQAVYAPQAAVTEKGLAWQDLVARPVRITSTDELDAWLADLRAQVDAYLQDGKSVTIQ